MTLITATYFINIYNFSGREPQMSLRFTLRSLVFQIIGVLGSPQGMLMLKFSKKNPQNIKMLKKCQTMFCEDQWEGNSGEVWNTALRFVWIVRILIFLLPLGSMLKKNESKLVKVFLFKISKIPIALYPMEKQRTSIFWKKSYYRAKWNETGTRR